jgi:hypothetical protein
LFQENKSFGSKKPFAFILWCTRSCVEHKHDRRLEKRLLVAGAKYWPQQFTSVEEMFNPILHLKQQQD